MSATTDRNRQASPKEIGRRLLHRLMKTALRARARAFPVEEDVRCLVVAPHQDDATLGCGGLILCKRLEGSPVDILYVTDGGASHPLHPTLTPGALSRQRQSEALSAAGTLRAERGRTHFLGARDGTLDRLDGPETDALVGRISQILVRTHPDEIFLRGAATAARSTMPRSSWCGARSNGRAWARASLSIPFGPFGRRSTSCAPLSPARGSGGSRSPAMGMSSVTR